MKRLEDSILFCNTNLNFHFPIAKEGIRNLQVSRLFCRLLKPLNFWMFIQAEHYPYLIDVLLHKKDMNFESTGHW